MESLQHYLEEMHDEGVMDSSGHFTVGFHALSKLRAFQLTNPDLYVLRLVAAGVALGATHFEATSDDRAFVFLMRGVHRREAQLNGIFDQLLSEETDRGMRDLAVGLNALLGRQPSPRILVSSWEGSNSSGIEILQEEDQVRITALTRDSAPPAPGVPKGLLIRVLRRLNRGALDGLFGGAVSPEQQTLAPVSRFCPVPLVVNGQPLHQRFYCREPWGGVLRLHGHVGPPLVTDLRALQEKCKAWMTPEPTELSFSSLILLHGDATAGMWWVHNGLVVRQGMLPGPGLVVIQSPHLRLDLSYQNLAEDEVFEHIRDTVQADLDQLVSQMVGAIWPLDASFGLASFVRNLTPRLEPATAKPLLMWLLKLRSQKERESPEYWREREYYIEVEGQDSFRQALLSNALRFWKAGHPVAPLAEVAAPHLKADNRACLIFGWTASEPPWKILQEVLWCFENKGAAYWDVWNNLMEQAPPSPFNSLVLADLCLGRGQLDTARSFYSEVEKVPVFETQAREGLLLCRLAQPGGSYLAKAGLEASTGLPGEEQNVGIFAATFRLFNDLMAHHSATDWRALVNHIQAGHLPGSPREQLYAGLARNLILQDKTVEAALVLLIGRAELALLD